MLAELGIAVLTAVLSSLLTLVLAKLALDRWGSGYAQSKLDHASGELERRLQAAAMKAGEDLLPELQQRVRAGFEEALASLASGKPFEKSMQEAARAGVRAIGDGLDALLGKKRD
jgi:hypothetical protein